jgi:diaminohydroxyphosphoribosylaminopyrimidine deaminase / 5-amino-6-(5-phosphoribosylamino)uracil reductase
MQRCLDLAAGGLGTVAPNPMVGAVIVHHDRIIGEGFHTGFGMPHAEVEAIRRVNDPSLLPDSTLYVNLEPCHHHGKTPPCTSLIIEKGIKRVVIGQRDPNPVAVGGIDYLRQEGVDVIAGVSEQECRWLNRRFNLFHEQKRPWLILKWAQTADGFVDIVREIPAARKPSWITDEVCRRLVHKWRSEEQAILAGSRTILYDNPQLNVRSWAGKDPIRISIDRSGALTAGAVSFTDALVHGSPLKLLDQTIPSILYTCTDQVSRPNLEFVRINPGEPVWPQVMADLYARNIQSVLIEGGPTLFETLIREDLWDEARVFVGPGWFGEGVRAPSFPFQPDESGTVGNSRLLKFHRINKSAQ